MVTHNMKLITEYLPGTTEVITEEVDGKKSLFIEGIFMQSAKKNRNGRIYPTPILESAVNKYIEEEVKTKGAIGELNHPKSPIPDPAMASHRIVELRKEGNDFYGKALILNTPQGRVVAGLLEGEVRLGVSSRGLGTVKAVNGVNEVQNDFLLKTVDIVHNPSAPDAFVNGIMEGVEYLVDGSVLDQNHVDRIEQEIKGASSADLNEVKMRVFKEAMLAMAQKKSINEAARMFRITVGPDKNNITRHPVDVEMRVKGTKPEFIVIDASGSKRTYNVQEFARLVGK